MNCLGRRLNVEHYDGVKYLPRSPEVGTRIPDGSCTRLATTLYVVEGRASSCPEYCKSTLD